MNKKTLLNRIDDLMERDKQRVSSIAESLLRSGAIDLDSWQDDYVLPKIVLTAVYDSLAKTYIPAYNKKAQKEVKNLSNFI